MPSLPPAYTVVLFTVQLVSFAVGSVLVQSSPLLESQKVYWA